MTTDAMKLAHKTLKMYEQLKGPETEPFGADYADLVGRNAHILARSVLAAEVLVDTLREIAAADISDSLGDLSFWAQEALQKYEYGEDA